jgi:AraC family transcriptional regulator
MQWNELYPKEHEPSFEQITEFADCSLLDSLDSHVRQAFNVKPKLSYSNCAMDNGQWKGWNVKYQKSGKSLCTLYPKQGYIQALVPVGAREMDEAELLMPLCTEYTQNLFKQTKRGKSGMSLAFIVENEDVLHDMKELIALRMGSR